MHLECTKNWVKWGGAEQEVGGVAVILPDFIIICENPVLQSEKSPRKMTLQAYINTDNTGIL